MRHSRPTVRHDQTSRRTRPWCAAACRGPRDLQRVVTSTSASSPNPKVCGVQSGNRAIEDKPVRIRAAQPVEPRSSQRSGRHAEHAPRAVPPHSSPRPSRPPGRPTGRCPPRSRSRARCCSRTSLRRRTCGEGCPCGCLDVPNDGSPLDAAGRSAEVMHPPRASSGVPSAIPGAPRTAEPKNPPGRDRSGTRRGCPPPPA